MARARGLRFRGRFDGWCLDAEAVSLEHASGNRHARIAHTSLLLCTVRFCLLVVRIPLSDTLVPCRRSTFVFRSLQCESRSTQQKADTFQVPTFRALHPRHTRYETWRGNNTSSHVLTDRGTCHRCRTAPQSTGTDTDTDAQQIETGRRITIIIITTIVAVYKNRIRYRNKHRPGISRF